MDKETEAKMQLARKMLSVKIDVSEVLLVTELPEETLLKIKEEVDEERKKNFEGLDELDVDFGMVIQDDFDDHGLGLDSLSMAAAEMEEADMEEEE